MNYSESIAQKVKGLSRSLVHPDQSLPKEYQPEEGQCTLNATELEGWRGMKPQFGYANDLEYGWTDHAWLKDAQGRVVDPTWIGCIAKEYVPHPEAFGRHQD